MRPVSVTTKTALILLSVMSLHSRPCPAAQVIEMKPSSSTLGKYEKLELLIRLDTQYSNPFDPEQIDLTVFIKTPGNRQITLPAFYCQDYERRKLSQGRNRANWYYPVGHGVWKARFAPMETGTYEATARLKDKNRTAESNSVRFTCTPSSRKGFLRVSRKDPRFLEFTEGDPFFAIGQNLAFIGEGQYVNLTKAEQIFSTLAQNGANFLRIWTCCEDWAMAIEARKSAWDRSWGRKKLIVPMPGSQADTNARKCVKLEGGDGASVSISPSHPVGLKPGTRYIFSGKFCADGPGGLRVEVGHGQNQQTFEAAEKGNWRKFKQEFVTGENDLWLGNITLRLSGAGAIWLDNLSLAEAGGGPELLWEADVNRPVRGVYNQLDCFMLDELIDTAERNSIYLMLCLITRDLYMNALSDPDSSEYHQAIEDARKFMRYAVARWGYSTSVAAWEYFNEMDPGKPTDRFYDKVGEYLEQIDIYHHLRTTSTWHPSARDCRHARLDIGQLHHYMRPGTKEEFKDEFAVVVDRTDFLRQHAPSKPALIGEFGLATPKWGLSENMKADSEGVHFHNSLWASAFAGASGTTMFWWWDQLDRQNAYHHYKPLASFMNEVCFAGLGELKATAPALGILTDNKQLRLLGYQGSDRSYLWIFNPQATWWNLVVDKAKPTEIKNAAVEIHGLQPGDYSVEWWHTHEGKTISERRASSTGDSLRIEVPPFSRDIACKIRISGRP
jgi:hypothetical protein